jgi:hypothetical protein
MHKKALYHVSPSVLTTHSVGLMKQTALILMTFITVFNLGVKECHLVLNQGSKIDASC